MDGIEKYYREKTNNNKKLKRDVLEAIDIFNHYLNEHVERELNIKISKLKISHIVNKLKSLPRFDVEATIDDYSENENPYTKESISINGEWVKSKDIDDIVNPPIN